MSDTTAKDDNIRQQKQCLRKTLRASMKELSEDDIQTQSAEVWRRVMDLDIYRNARSVGLFLSMPSGEIDTDAILQDCVANGKNIYVPQVGKNFELCDMELRKVILDDSNNKLFHKTWPKNKWKIPEPPADMPFVKAAPGDLDLLIVPGLGFDCSKNRLGQGKGYYDRFIARMSVAEKPLPLVAVALTPQLVTHQSIPVAEYDRPMDVIVLPEKIIGSVP
jgi:5-formyltetrahydrofolate cyclo-ligase